MVRPLPAAGRSQLCDSLAPPLWIWRPLFESGSRGPRPSVLECASRDATRTSATICTLRGELGGAGPRHGPRVRDARLFRHAPKGQELSGSSPFSFLCVVGLPRISPQPSSTDRERLARPNLGAQAGVECRSFCYATT